MQTRTLTHSSHSSGRQYVIIFPCLPFILSAVLHIHKTTETMASSGLPMTNRIVSNNNTYMYLCRWLFVLHRDRDWLQQMVQLISPLFKNIELIVKHKVYSSTHSELGFNINSRSEQQRSLTLWYSWICRPSMDRSLGRETLVTLSCCSISAISNNRAKCIQKGWGAVQDIISTTWSCAAFFAVN